MFYTYIIQSQKDHSYYVGQSENPERRLEKHNNSKTGYTSRKQPWELVYKESFETRSEAIKREREIKSKKSRVYIDSLISNNINTDYFLLPLHTILIVL